MLHDITQGVNQEKMFLARLTMLTRKINSKLTLKIYQLGIWDLTKEACLH